MLSVYPNPVQNKLQVGLRHDPVPGSTLYLYDPAGRLIRRFSINSRHMVIDMQRRSSGLYLLRYQDGDHSQGIRVIKQ